MAKYDLSKPLYIGFYALRNFPASNINRGEANEMKTVLSGGALRGRISSQCLKRAIRKYFQSKLREKCGIRTRKAKVALKEEILTLFSDISDEDAEAIAAWAVYAAGLKTETSKSDDRRGKAKKIEAEIVGDDTAEEKQTKEKNDTMFFFNHSEISNLATEAVNAWRKDPTCIEDRSEKKKGLESALVSDDLSIDVALFGRMAASNEKLNVEAACQVAHAFTTHALMPESDFFTAVDDFTSLGDSNLGAGHMGSTEYGSGTYYEYANINVTDLVKKLGKDGAEQAITLFIEAFASSTPTGHINSFAHGTLPSLLYVTFRDDMPVNLCNAFDKPVTSETGYIDTSIEALKKYADEAYENYGAPVKEFYVGKDFRGQKLNLKDMINAVSDMFMEV